MLEQEQSVQPELIASTLTWWADAGVDALVDEVPREWLTSAPVVAPVALANSAESRVVVERAERPAAPLIEMPKTLPEFLDWVAQDWSASAAGPAAQRVAPAGDAGSPIMVLIDMPEPGDVQAGKLLSGEAGELFEKMLSAIKQSRETIWLGSLCPARPPGGIVAPDMVAQLMPVARQHVDLIAPKRLWLMGQTVSRAFIGADAMPGTGCLRKINHEGRSVEAVASFSPRFLLQQPKRKAAAWADMQALVEGM